LSEAIAIDLYPTAFPIAKFATELLKFVRMILERAGFTLLIATSAEAATLIDQEYTGTIDLLLTAASLPGSSELELAQQLAWSRPELHVMLMSGYTAVGSLAASHGWSFIDKPFLPDVLVDRVTEAIDLAVAATVASHPVWSENSNLPPLGRLRI
jgi:DNA-binding NtrC family response regulator